jgi:hypothetical protein
MALALTINGTDRIANLLAGTLRTKTTAEAAKGTAEFTLQDFTPVADETVVITDGATTYFNGHVRIITTREFTTGHWTAQVSCQDDGAAVTASNAPFALCDKPATAFVDALTAMTPLSWWRLGESAGTTADDVMGVNDGTYVDTPTLGAAGAVDDGNTAVTFNGSSEYVSVGNNLLRAKTDMTITGWFKCGVTAALKAVYCERIAASAYPVIRVAVQANGYLAFAWQDDAGTIDTIVADYQRWDDGAWHHFGVTKDNAHVTVIVDGRVCYETDLTATNTQTGTMVARIGADAKDGLYFPGTIDDVQIFDRALADEEVASMYLLRACEPYASLSITTTSARGTSYTATEVTGTATTWVAGLGPNQRVGISSANNSLAGAAGPASGWWLSAGFYIQEFGVSWPTKLVPLYTITFGSPPVTLGKML